MPICGTESQMPSHRRSSQSLSVLSPAKAAASRSEPSSSRRAKSPHDLHPACVVLGRVGARRDCFEGDFTTSAVSHTSMGDEISVSFELVEPPEASLLVLDWPQGPGPMESTLSYPHVLSSHGNAVLFEVSSRAKRPSAPIDYFVYAASSEPSKQSSLSRLPACYWKGNSSADPPRPRILNRKATGILSLSERPFSFQVIELERAADSPSNMNMYMFWSEPNKWKVFKGIQVYHCRGGSDMYWWSTDAVVPRCGNHLVWIDYYRGMIIGTMRGTVREPCLEYVAFPIHPVQGNPEDSDHGRGCPETSRNVCVTRNHLIKFICVNQHSSGFSITMWCWAATHQKWREEVTMDASQFWALDPENRLPHVLPEFPVIDLMDGNTVCFLLNKGRHALDLAAPTWIVQVDMKDQRLLGATPYSREERLSCQRPFLTARRMSMGHSLICSDMPSYMLRKLTKARG
ncbi:hypothetical protein QOZ80_9BG0693740 [Eleusine coracana subsp. coracana]|nr:hypothetical protein QOZ80_9BG0693740 [Eleusine coracana subsp. coracana]